MQRRQFPFRDSDLFRHLSSFVVPSVVEESLTIPPLRGLIRSNSQRCLDSARHDGKAKL